MPKEYMEWKQAIAQYLQLHRVKPFHGRVEIALTFNKKSVDVVIRECNYVVRFGSADIDNLAGGIMDALENAGVLMNDRDVVSLHATFPADEDTE